MEDNQLLLEQICKNHPGIGAETLEQVIVLAVELAREGREGRKVGTMFVVSDADETLRSFLRSSPKCGCSVATDSTERMVAGRSNT